MPSTMIRLALTGTTGWMGRHLLSRLAARSDLTPLPLEGDILRPETFQTPFDGLIHLAGAMPGHFARDPKHAWEVNVEGTHQAVRACQHWGAFMVFASTANVYPVEAQGLIQEEMPTAPRSPYGQSKLAAERLCLAASEQGNLPVRILRVFNPYGPGQGEEMLLGYLAACLRRGEPAHLRTPHAARDFIHVTDVAEAFLRAATPFTGSQIINIGSGESFSVLEAAQAMARAAGKPLRLEPPPDPRPPLTPDHSRADIRRAEQLLGWTPRIPFASGMASCLEDQ